MLPNRSTLQTAFSLVEVAVALGIISFALLAVVGLLPAGLDAQRQAANQARGVQALSEISNALRAIYRETGSGSPAYPYPLESITPGVSSEVEYALLENGRIAPSGPPAQGRVFIRQDAQTANEVIPVYVSIAWPESAQRQGNSWTNAQGFVESMIFITPP